MILHEFILKPLLYKEEYQVVFNNTVWLIKPKSNVIILDIEHTNKKRFSQG